MRNVSRSTHSVSLVTIAPPIRSEWPPMYFVTLCTTASAPSSSGRWSTGVANVLSTTTRAPASCAIAATAGRSTILSIGFDGVSTHTSLVLGRIAVRSAVASAMSTVE